MQSEEFEYINGGGPSPSGSGRDSPGMVHVESGENLERSERGAGPSGSSDQPTVESSDVDSDFKGRYAALSEVISTRFNKRNRYEREGEIGTPVTTSTIVAAAIASVSIVLIIIGFYPFVFGLILGDPFNYTNIPFPLCDPSVQYDDISSCDTLPAQHVWHVREITPLLVGVCYNNRFSSSNEITYTFKRRIVNDGDGTIIPIDDSFTSASKGCMFRRNVLNLIPDRVYPGTWHFEGVSQVISWKAEEIPWRSVSFTVGP